MVEIPIADEAQACPDHDVIAGHWGWIRPWPVARATFVGVHA
jgi:hypothetical protein